MQYVYTKAKWMFSPNEKKWSDYVKYIKKLHNKNDVNNIRIHSALYKTISKCNRFVYASIYKQEY